MSVKLDVRQRRTLQRILASRAHLDNNRVGAGKTRTALAAWEVLHGRGEVDRLLVLAPKTVLRSAWIAEARLFPGLQLHCLDGSTRAERRRELWTDGSSAAGWVVSHGLIHRDPDLRSMFEIVSRHRTMLVVDEAHRFRSPQAKGNLILRQLAARAARVLLLTATQIRGGGPADFYGLFSILGHDLEPWTLWMYNWCITRNITVAGGRRTITLPVRVRPEREAEYRRIIGAYTTRYDTPIRNAPRIIKVSLELSARERREYDALFQQYRHAVQAGAPDMLARHNELRLYLSARKRKTATKRQYVIDLLPELASTGKTLIYSPYRTAVESLAEALNDTYPDWRFELLTGRHSGRQRQENIERFLNDPACVALLLTQAGSEGANLWQSPVAPVCQLVIMDRDYDPQSEVQLIGRLRPDRQKVEVTVLILVCAGTIEERIEEIHQRKWKAIRQGTVYTAREMHRDLVSAV